MKPDIAIIGVAILIATGFGALLYFQNKQNQAIQSALGTNTAASTAPSQAPATQVQATPTQQGGLPSQQILVLGGSVPPGSPVSPATPPVTPVTPASPSS